MSDSTSTKIDFLKKVGTEDIPHSGGTLFDHLIGVFNILKDMDVAQHVQDAGLYHSIYGTAVFHHQTTSDRGVVQAIIGEDAEHLVVAVVRGRRGIEGNEALVSVRRGRSLEGSEAVVRVEGRLEVQDVRLDGVEHRGAG